MRRKATRVLAGALALAAGGCATHYQTGSMVSAGTGSSYSSFSFSAGLRGVQAAFGAATPNSGQGGPPAGNSVTGGAGGIQLDARDGLAVFLAIVLSMLNSLQEQASRDAMPFQGAQPFEHLLTGAGANLPWSDRLGAPEPDPGRRVRELDCTQPFDADGANIKCR